MSNYNDKKDVIQFITKHSDIDSSKIKTLKKIHEGYTNLNYLLITIDNKKYQVRFAQNNELVNRANEKIFIEKFLDISSYLYIDETGNYIRKWVEGTNLKLGFKKREKLTIVAKALKKLHATNYKGVEILKHDYHEYDKYIYRIDEEYRDLFNRLVTKYAGIKQVLSHNDVSPLNMVWNKKEKSITLIDFEWVRLNNPYFDIASFFKETNLSIRWLEHLRWNYDQSLKIDILVDHFFISCMYSLLWSFSMNQSSKIKDFQKFNYKRMIYAYECRNHLQELKLYK